MTTATATPARKTGRTRHVWDTSMVAHLWANQSQDSARNPQGNFYFEGATIYSYGGHFPIARHVKNKRGERAVLFTVRTYSNTTAKHLGETRGALRDTARVFDVPRLVTTADDHAANWKHFIGLIESLVKSAGKATTYALSTVASIHATIRSANAYADFFGLRVKRLTHDTQAGVDLASLEATAREKTTRANERDRVRREAQEERWRIAREKRREENAARLVQWLAGENVSYHSDWDEPTRLRVKGENIETSRGATFPLDHGIRAFPVLLKIRESGRDWHRNGGTIRLGHFQVDSVDGETAKVRAGCHVVEWGEVERIARQLGLMP